MRPRLPSLCLLLVAALPARAGDESPSPAQAPPRRVDFFCAYAEDARLVRVVPLVGGRLPDLARGEELRPEWNDEVDRDAAPGLVILPDADVLVIARGAHASSWVRFRRDDDGWRERARGERAHLRLIGAADLDGDDEAELVLLEPRERHEPWRVSVARGLPTGGFAFDAPAQVVADPTHAAFFALGDVTDDGRPDLLFHLQPHGADVPVHVQVASARADRTFEPPTTLARGPGGAASLAVARLDADLRTTIVLGADDDLEDVGQAQEIVRDAQGRWVVRPGVDLEPDREGWAHDEGYWILTPTDLDLDGYTDLVARWDAWWAPETRQTVLLVLRGTQAGFRPAERLLDRAFPKERPPAFACPPPP